MNYKFTLVVKGKNFGKILEKITKYDLTISQYDCKPGSWEQSNIVAIGKIENVSKWYSEIEDTFPPTTKSDFTFPDGSLLFYRSENIDD